MHLVSDSGGGAQAFSAWLNGTFLGSSTTGSADFTFPAGSVQRERRQRAVRADREHGPRGGLQLDQRQQDRARADERVADRRAVRTRSPGGCRACAAARTRSTRCAGRCTTGGLYGERAGWSLPGYPDGDWQTVTLPTQRHHVRASRGTATTSALDLPARPGHLARPDRSPTTRRASTAPRSSSTAGMLGNYVNYLGPQHSFPIPNGILNPNGDEHASPSPCGTSTGRTGGLGKVALTELRQLRLVAAGRAERREPGLRPRRSTRCRRRRAPTVALTVPGTVAGGQTFTATATVRVPAGRQPAPRVTAALRAADGWTATPAPTPRRGRFAPGQAVTFRWPVTAPAGTLPQASALPALVHYTQRGPSGDELRRADLGAVPPPPPAGTDAVSDLPFLSATNGWGPVERDTSNGESAAGDGKTITIAGVDVRQGPRHELGQRRRALPRRPVLAASPRRSASTTRPTARGTVTFTVAADGKTLASTRRRSRRHTAAQPSPPT